MSESVLPRPCRITLRSLLSAAFAALPVFGGIFAPPAASAANFGVSCDGTNDYVTFGTAPGLGASTFTIETWFKRTGTGAAANTGTGGVDAIPLVTKGRSEGDNSNVDMNYFLGIRTTNNALCADFEEGATGASPGLNHPIVGVTPISNNVWYHAAATYNGTKWQLFLNGVLEAELTVGRPPRADSIQHAALGTTLNSTGAAAGFFAGVLDEARIWNYARSAQEIADNKNLEIQSAPGLRGRWGLNEGSGVAAADSSGNAVNGTLVNGPVWVAGFDPAVTVAVTRGPYLQTGTATSVIVRWRTSTATNSRVDFGTSPSVLTNTVSDATVTSEHELKLTGLLPDTQYYYGVGTSTSLLAVGSEFTFFTAPPIGTAQPTRIWVLGDSGTKDATAAAVRNGYTTFAGNRMTDVWLMLGDNAYNSGTDAEFQAAVFDMYPTYLRQAVLWSALGNHETNQLTNPDITTVPYFNIFTFPKNGEAGGVPSGTEKYYSFDYGRIHFIALDSMTSSRQPGSPMLNWLQADLESTNQDWIICFFHHPPYTKGSHNSDTETELTEIRRNVLPLLEAGGVDLVLAGHSHSYERSYFINGHYGLSSSFSGANLIDGGNGRDDGTGTYDKPAGLPANQGSVYIVAGNGGHVTSWTGGSTAEFNPTPHAAMFYSALHVGSLAIDVDGNRLDCKMIRTTGAVDDYFSIVKNVPNQPPVVAVSSPAEGATFTAPASVTITADATDSDGTIAQVDFYGGNTLLASDTVAPFSATWSNVPAGSYALTATATDNLGATITSAAVNITVTTPPPAAPGALTATGGDGQVSLAWQASANATSYNLKRGTASGGPYATVASGIAGTGFTDTSVTNGVTYFYVATAIGAGGESPASNEATATPSAPAIPPPAPSGLVATAGNAQVALSWGASSGATSYTVKRAGISGGPYSAIASGISNTAFTDSSVANGTTYFYVVTATNGAGESGNSNEATATPTAPPTAPAAPSNLTASTASTTQINLLWADNSANETGFAIERSANGNSYSQIATVGANARTFANTGLSANKKYFYRVRAFNSVGFSAYSNEATAKTAR